MTDQIEIRSGETTTPPEIDETIREFCRGISDNSPPVYVRVERRRDAQLNECFFNVQRAVEKKGGQLIYGWTIWLWPKVLVEAEHHAVWQKPTGELADVSPKADGEAKILFLTDPVATFDFQKRSSRDNIRKALVDDDDVRALISFTKQIYDLVTDNKVGSKVTLTGPDIGLFKSLQSIRSDLVRRIKIRVAS